MCRLLRISNGCDFSQLACFAVTKLFFHQRGNLVFWLNIFLYPSCAVEREGFTESDDPIIASVSFPHRLAAKES